MIEYHLSYEDYARWVIYHPGATYDDFAAKFTGGADVFYEEPVAPEPEPSEPTASLTLEEIFQIIDAVNATGDEDPVELVPGPVSEPGTTEALEPMKVIGMDRLQELAESIQQQTETHPALTTPFTDYTVTEALLLLVLILSVISMCIKMLKGGFSWLLW